MKDTIPAPSTIEVEETDAIKVEETDTPVHPHLEEITKCPNDWQLEKKDPVPYKALEDIPYTLVDSKDLLHGMMTKLKNEQEIGLGTRRFTYRSFNGISCLIELTTRSEAFLVDTIALKDEVKVLNEVFTSSGVLKVMHAGENDVENLQKDLGLYVVNVFSVLVAWKSLHPAAVDGSKWYKKNHHTTRSLSVGSILKEYCGVDLEEYFKEHRAGEHHRDWHVRPLTDEKVKYARIQVQYLLHLYDRLRNLLIEQDSLRHVYKKCNEFCKQVWYPGKYVLHPDLHKKFYKTMRTRKREGPLSKLQMEVFRVLYDWRHTTAEKHDEGRAYLLKDLAIYDIAKALPKDVDEIRNVISPDIPAPLLEENLEHVSELINKAVAAMAGAPDAEQKVPFFQRAKNSGVGAKRRNGNHTTSENNAKKSTKALAPLDAKHPVSALAEHCSRSKIAMPAYELVTSERDEQDNSWRFMMSVVVDDMPYQPPEPSLNKKHAKAMAAAVALKTLGLVSADTNFNGFLGMK